MEFHTHHKPFLYISVHPHWVLSLSFTPGMKLLKTASYAKLSLLCMPNALQSRAETLQALFVSGILIKDPKWVKKNDQYCDMS